MGSNAFQFVPGIRDGGPRIARGDGYNIRFGGVYGYLFVTCGYFLYTKGLGLSLDDGDGAGLGYRHVDAQTGYGSLVAFSASGTALFRCPT